MLSPGFRIHFASRANSNLKPQESTVYITFIGKASDSTISTKMEELIPPNTAISAWQQICESNPLFHGISLSLNDRTKEMIIEEMNDRIENKPSDGGLPVTPNSAEIRPRTFCHFPAWIIFIFMLSICIACNQRECVSTNQQRSAYNLEAQTESSNTTEYEWSRTHFTTRNCSSSYIS